MDRELNWKKVITSEDVHLLNRNFNPGTHCLIHPIIYSYTLLELVYKSIPSVQSSPSLEACLKAFHS